MSSEITVFDMAIALGILPGYFLICLCAAIYDYKKHKDDKIDE